MSPTVPNRGQSNVVGVAVLIGITLLGVGAIIAGTGVVVQTSASRAEATAVSEDFDDLVTAASRTRRTAETIELYGGGLAEIDRRVRIRHEGVEILDRHIGGMHYRARSGQASVTVLNGAILRTVGGATTVDRSPSMAVGGPNGSLMFAVVDIDWEGNAPDASERSLRLTVETTVERRVREFGRVNLTLETGKPAIWARILGRHGGTVSVDRGPGFARSTVHAGFENRRLYLVIRELTVSVDG